MNQFIENAKKEFLDKGYTSFNIKNFDSEFASFIENNLACDYDKNFKECFFEGRFDSETLKTHFKKENFEEAEQYRKDLLKEHDWMDGERPNMTQCWYWSHIDYVQSYLNIRDINLKKYIENKIYNILKFFYEFSDNTELNQDELKFTLYNKDCVFTQHSDGIGVNYCSIIIYLNKNYNKEYGGLLLLNDEYVLPELGTVALMDLSKHNTKHGVSKVLDGPGRYAILSFPVIV